MNKIANLKTQISKLSFFLRRPPLIVVTGNTRQIVKEAISQLLKSYFRIEKEVLILESEEDKIKDLAFYLKNSRKSAVVITQGVREASSLIKTLPAPTNLILNFDENICREIKNTANLNAITFGFQEGADLRVTDIKFNHETNFKINYKGNIVPVWLKGILSKEQIYDTLATASVGTIFNLNLIEISQTLKSSQTLPEKTKEA